MPRLAGYGLKDATLANKAAALPDAVSPVLSLAGMIWLPASCWALKGLKAIMVPLNSSLPMSYFVRMV